MLGDEEGSPPSWPAVRIAGAGCAANVCAVYRTRRDHMESVAERDAAGRWPGLVQCAERHRNTEQSPFGLRRERGHEEAVLFLGFIAQGIP